MYVEQRLTNCEVCARVLALQYGWWAGRVPSLDEPILLRTFACPVCGHANPLITLLHAFDFVLKVVPVPQCETRVRPNSIRRFLTSTPPSPSRIEERADDSVASFRPFPLTEQVWPYLVWLLQ